MRRVDNIWQVVLQFVAAVAALFFILWLVYYFINGRLFKNIPGGTIKIIERKFLDRTTSIALVRLLDDYYYILITQNGGTIIKKLDEIEAGKILVKETKNVKFSDIFHKKLGRK